MVNRREVKNSQNPYAVGLREYDTTVGHVLRVISCMHLEVIFKIHGDVIGPGTLIGPPATVPIPKTCHREI